MLLILPDLYKLKKLCNYRWYFSAQFWLFSNGNSISKLYVFWMLTGLWLELCGGRHYGIFQWFLRPFVYALHTTLSLSVSRNYDLFLILEVSKTDEVSFPWSCYWRHITRIFLILCSCFQRIKLPSTLKLKRDTFCQQSERG